MASPKYRFSTSDGGRTYQRKLYGLESLCLQFSLYDGLIWFNGSCHSQIQGATSRAALEPLLEQAWIRLRHLAPSLALSTTLDRENLEWTATYSVPSSTQDAYAWAKETIVWGEKEKHFTQHMNEQTGTYWDHSNGSPSIKLFVNPVNLAEGRWLFSFCASHGMIDGRMSIYLFNSLFHSLNNSITGDVTGLNDITWGEEVTRLPPASVVATGIFDSEVEGAEDKAKQAPALPAGLIPFIPPSVEIPTPSQHHTTARLITLSKDQTRALRALCKSHGETITNVLDSLFALSDTEGILKLAATKGPEHLEAVVGAFNNSTHWMVPFTFKDQRRSLPEHSKLSGPNGTPMFTVDGFKLLVGMPTIRSILGYNPSAQTFAGFEFIDQFWSQLVPEVKGAREFNKADHGAYIQREAVNQAGVRTFVPEQFGVRIFATSSLGHVEGFGGLVDFTPEVAQATGKCVRALDVNMQIRPPSISPMMVTTYWQFDDKLNFYPHASSKWYSDKDMDIFEGTFFKWLGALTEKSA